MNILTFVLLHWLIEEILQENVTQWHWVYSWSGAVYIALALKVIEQVLLTSKLDRKIKYSAELPELSGNKLACPSARLLLAPHELISSAEQQATSRGAGQCWCSYTLLVPRLTHLELAGGICTILLVLCEGILTVKGKTKNKGNQTLIQWNMFAADIARWSQ